MSIKSIFRFLVLINVLMQILYSGSVGKIAGIVEDKETGKPLVGVNIIIDGMLMGASTSDNGTYIILNIPPGVYSISASMVGYTEVKVSGVVVSTDFTTNIDFNLEIEAIKGEKVVVVAERPLVQHDLTASVSIVNQKIISQMPISNFKDVLVLQAGVAPQVTLLDRDELGFFTTAPSDGLHFRGGRTNEATYLLNGVSLDDPIWGGFQLSSLPLGALTNMTIYSGTFPAEYGEALSAVINMNTDVGSDNRIIGSYDFYTDKTGIAESENVFSNEFMIRGPLPFTGNRVRAFLSGRVLTSDGYLFGYLLPEWRDTEGKDKSGHRIPVPMNYHDNISYLGNLSWNITKSFQVRAHGLILNTNRGVYSHYFKYNPYGSPLVTFEDSQAGIQLVHIVSPRFFYKIAYSNYEKYFQSIVFEDYESNNIEARIPSPDNFSVSGTNYIWMKSNSNTRETSTDFNWQINNTHQIKAGVDQKLYKIHYERRNPSAASDSVNMDPWELYTKRPNILSAYIMDKMEFREIGMVLNIGLRFDRVEPDAYGMKDIKHPQTTELFKAKVKQNWSPRIGVSYPISDKAAFRFSYGIFHQFPKFFILYQNINEDSPLFPNSDLSALQTAVGNGDMSPERTISYETGVQTRIGQLISAEIIGFYRDMNDLIGIHFIQGEDVPKDYPLFENQDFGTAKGIEIKLYTRPINYWYWMLNYTFTKSRVSSSNVWYRPVIPVFRTQIADWDQPHTLTFIVDFHKPDNWGFNITGDIRSGLPYTVELQPNTERGPFQHTVNFRADKRIHIKGLKCSLYLQVLNLFNHKNIYWVYTDSGKPGIDNNPATNDDQTWDPSAWGSGRRVRIGIRMSL